MKRFDAHLLAVAPNAVAATGSSTASETKSSVAPYFEPQTVVTLDADNKPLNQYQDQCWDFKALSVDGRTTKRLYFFEAQPQSVPGTVSLPDLAALIREQHKALLWLHIDAGRMRALRTLEMANGALNRIARDAYSHGVSLFGIMTDPIRLAAVIEAMNSGWIKQTKVLIKTVWRHQTFLKIDGEVKLKQLQDAIKAVAANASEEDRQTPILPSRIYCAILGNLLESLDEIERDLDETLQAYREERSATLNAREGLSPRQLGRHRGKTLAKVDEFLKSKGYNPKAGDKRRVFLEGLLNRSQMKLMRKRGPKALLVRSGGSMQDMSICKTVDTPQSGTARRWSESCATASASTSRPSRPGWWSKRSSQRFRLPAWHFATVSTPTSFAAG